MPEYDVFAENYVTQQEHGDLASAIEFPAMTKLVGRIKGKKLLDLGAGIGWHAHFYAKKGACVTALDNSEKLLNKITNKKITVVHHDLNKKLPFDKKSFDIITASLALDHIRNLNKLLKEVQRTLKDDGTFYCSIPNPVFHQEEQLIGMRTNEDDVDIYGNYFYPRKIVNEYDDVTITLYHRTLTDYFTAFTKAGFTVQVLLEPQPPRSMKKKDLLGYSYASRNPVFLLFKLMRAD